MGKTYRKDRKNPSKKLRDGEPQYFAASCEHGGSCTWCESNRTIATKRKMLEVIDSLEEVMEELV